jgi:hypothetical protein
MVWSYNDGGREAAGFRGEAGDCVTRAIAIATGISYRDVYDELASRNAAKGNSKSARNGVHKAIYQKWLYELGWNWTATMGIGTGCRVHLNAEELPSGILIARLSRHICAVVDGVVQDTHDPTREGTRCVYGYWQ